MKDKSENDLVLKKLQTELRRGDLVLATLCLLENPDYGYEIIKRLRESGLEVSQDTLYPLLRRLEDQKLLQGEWETSGNRPRKLYRITPQGIPLREKLIEEWKKQKKAMEVWL